MKIKLTWARYDLQRHPSGAKHWVHCIYRTKKAALAELNMNGRERTQAVAKYDHETMDVPLILCRD